MRVLFVILLVLAIWRTTRLLVVDEFPPVRAVREWFITTFGEISKAGEITGGRRLGGIGHAIAYVWDCPWCMSVYVGAGLVAAADWRLDVPFPWLIVAAGSLAAGLGATLEQAAEQRYKLRERELDDDRRR